MVPQNSGFLYGTKISQMNQSNQSINVTFKFKKKTGEPSQSSGGFENWNKIILPLKEFNFLTIFSEYTTVVTHNPLDLKDSGRIGQVVVVKRLFK